MENTTNGDSLKPSWRISGQVAPGSLPGYVGIQTINKWSDPSGNVPYALTEDEKIVVNRTSDDETKRKAIDASVKWGEIGDDVREQMRKRRFKGGGST